MDAGTPRRRVGRGRVRVAVLLAAGSVAVGGCSSAASVAVPPPVGPGAGCGALHRALPDDVGGRSTRDVTPASRRTAAWGSPALVLRCGVAKPAGLGATSQLIEVDGVDWFLVERPAAYVFTTVGRSAYVEVRVPSSVDRSSATGPLVDLGQAVKRALPVS